jgi:integrase
VAWVERRNGRFLVGWREDGRKRYVSCTSEAEALDYRRHIEDGRGGPLFRQYVQDVLDAAEDLRETTRERYAAAARLYLVPPLGGLPLGALSPDCLRDVFAALRQRGLSATTRLHARCLLSRVFRQALADGFLTTNPLAGVPRPRRDSGKFLVPLEVDQIEALGSAIKRRYRVSVLMAGYAGLRIGEIGGLQLDHIDRQSRELRVFQAATSTAEKAWIAETKTAAGRRAVPLPGFLLTEIDEHIAAFGVSRDGRVFTTEGYRILHKGNMAPRFRHARRKVGLPEDVTFHHLRHSYAALLIREGAHPKVVQALMGHSSIATTLDIYGHLFPGMGDELAARLEERRVQFLASIRGQDRSLPD